MSMSFILGVAVRIGRQLFCSVPTGRWPSAGLWGVSLGSVPGRNRWSGLIHPHTLELEGSVCAVSFLADTCRRHRRCCLQAERLHSTLSPFPHGNTESWFLCLAVGFDNLCLFTPFACQTASLPISLNSLCTLDMTCHTRRDVSHTSSSLRGII